MMAKPTPTPATPAGESVTDGPVQGTTLANVDNLPATRQPTSVIEKPVALLTLSYVEALVRQEKESTASL